MWLLSLIAVLINTLVITRQISLLSYGVRKISSGEFGYKLQPNDLWGEIKLLFDEFNKMSTKLHQYEEKNIERAKKYGTMTAGQEIDYWQQRLLAYEPGSTKYNEIVDKIYDLENDKFQNELDFIKDAGYDVISVGKINDIFVGQGITESNKSTSSVHGMEQTIEIAERDFSGLCFTNLVDFDMKQQSCKGQK